MAEIFGQSFVDAAGKTNKSWAVAVSIVGQMIALAISILIPLVFAGVLPKAQLISMLTAPSSPVAPPPPAPAEKVVAKPAPRQFLGDVVLAPKTIPKQVAMIQEEVLPLSSSIAVAGASIIPGGVSQGIFGLIGAPPPPPVPPPVVTQAAGLATPARIPVTSSLQSAKLIKKPLPVYPAFARQARIQGTVKFTAIIRKDGTIQNLTLISGHPLLVQAAQDAVKQWLYQPTVLNGEPVEVVTEIDVNFALSQ